MHSLSIHNLWCVLKFEKYTLLLLRLSCFTQYIVKNKCWCMTTNGIVDWHSYLMLTFFLFLLLLLLFNFLFFNLLQNIFAQAQAPWNKYHVDAVQNWIEPKKIFLLLDGLKLVLIKTCYSVEALMALRSVLNILSVYNFSCNSSFEKSSENWKKLFH